MVRWIAALRRALGKPPRYIAERVLRELGMWSERYRAPRRLRKLTAVVLAREAGHATVAAWWSALAARQYLAVARTSADIYDQLCPGDALRILAAAENAHAHRIDLLGSGVVDLGAKIDWQRDYKSGHRWPQGYCRDLEYGRPDQRADVKFPWELSRMQWLVPLGQAHALTRDERCAADARAVVESWIADNPHAGSINWASTMEVALRIVVWTWLFHVFKHSHAWADDEFRALFLRLLYLHADFTARHLEKADVNGNHYTANAAGLVYAGLFFGGRGEPQRWLDLGWGILCHELPKQVHADGVDFEGSVAYHRFVLELFLLPALYRRVHGMAVPDFYRERLVAMARYTAAYSRGDGSIPLFGDADDARVLPFGGQDINDHRYLLGLVGAAFGVNGLAQAFTGPKAEVFWLLGSEAASALSENAVVARPSSAVFPNGGMYVLRNARDHVFVSCAPLGLAGRGGHSHNDILSFEAVIDGELLVSDCGAYLYTSDATERNRFKSTAYHNTPQVDGVEVNRFIPGYLLGLHNDAKPEVREACHSSDFDRIVVSHTGYLRLDKPVRPVRTFVLHHDEHRLEIEDDFEGEGEHRVEIPLHLAPGVQTERVDPNRVFFARGEKRYVLTWTSPAAWSLEVECGRVSQSYGTYRDTTVLVWRRAGKLAALEMQILPLRS